MATFPASTSFVNGDIYTATNVNDFGDLINQLNTRNPAAYSTWTPTWTNVTVGNGTTTARYVQIGKTVHFMLKLVFGSTTTLGGDVQVSLPVSASANIITANFNLQYTDASASANYIGAVTALGVGTVYLRVINAAGTYASGSTLSATVPMTWTTSDVIALSGTYEAA